MWLFLAFLLVPIIEIALFIQVGGLIGLWPTLGIVVLTAIAGTMLVRGQGLATLAQLQASLAEGRDPTGHIAHGAFILVAGVLLLTPGFFTDATGFLLLLPPVRAALIRYGAARMAGRFTVRGAAYTRAARSGSADPHVIETEYFEVGDEDGNEQKRGSSGWTRPR